MPGKAKRLGCCFCPPPSQETCLRIETAYFLRRTERMRFTFTTTRNLAASVLRYVTASHTNSEVGHLPGMVCLGHSHDVLQLPAGGGRRSAIVGGARPRP